MSFGFDDDSNYYDHVAFDHGINREQIAENESKMRVIISEFLQGDLNIYQLKAALNMLEKDALDLV